MNYSQIRSQARENLRGVWPVSIGVAIIAVLLGGIVNGSSFIPQISTEIESPILQEINYALNQGLTFGSLTFSISSGLLGLAAFIIGGAVELGHAQFLLNQHDGREARFNDLFSQFHRFGQGFAQNFLRGLYTALWSLLLVIPGIVAALSYSMTPFIMVDHPELTASEAIARSKEMMDGHKWEYFVLGLTFFGWSLLCGLTGNLGYIFLNPYTSASSAVFYRNLQREAPQRIVDGYVVVE